MNFIDILRKLGIFRSGSVSAKYTSGKDRPTEFLMDDVYNAKEDLTTKKDIARLKNRRSYKEVVKGNKNNSNSKYFLIFVIIGGLMMLLFLMKTGFNFWFFVMLIVWSWFLWLIKKWMTLGTFVVLKTIFIGIFIVFLTVIFMVISTGDEKNSQSNSDAVKNSAENNIDNSDSIYSEAYFGEMFANNQFVDAGINTKTVSIQINAIVRMYTPDPYKKVSIKNFKLKKDLPGDVLLLIPAGGYSEKFSKDNKIDYRIVEKTNMEPRTITKNMASMSIEIKAINAYNFDTNKAFEMSTKGIEPDKTFQYVGLSAKDLDNTLEFDVEIEFESGKNKIVHFVGKIDGAKFLEKGRLEFVEMKVEEKNKS